MTNWNEALFGTSEAGTRALEELATVTGGSMGPPLFADRCSWHRDHSQSKSGSAVLVWPKAIGLAHAVDKKRAEVDLIDLDGVSVNVEPAEAGRATCTITLGARSTTFATTECVARSIVVVAESRPGWWQQVNGWPPAFAATLIDDAPDGRRFEYSCTVACRPAGFEVRTNEFGSRFTPWSAVSEFSVEGVDEFKSRPSAGAILMFGIIGLAARQHEAQSFLVIQADTGRTFVLAAPILPSALRGLVGAVLIARAQTVVSAASLPPPPPGADPPAWKPDPTARHQYRWWDGARWTDQVADAGVAGSDPIG